MKRLFLVLLILAAIVAGALFFWRSDSAQPAASGPAGAAPSGDGSRSGPLLHPVERSTLAITGRVVDARGEPVAGAEVHLGPQGAESMAAEPCDCPTCHKRLLECGCNAAAAKVAQLVTRREGELLPEQTVRTDPSGEFTFSGDLPAHALVWATAAGYGPTFRSGVDAGTRVELTLVAARVITGRVVDEDNHPVPGALLTAVPTLLPRFLDATAAADGTFRIDGVADTPLYVAASARGFLPTGVPLANATPPPLTIVLPRPRTVEGVVLDGGAPAHGASVKLYAEHFSLAQNAATGSFRVEGLFPGTYSISASRAGRFATAEVEVTESVSHVELRLEDALAIHGRVVDDSGAPVEGAAVTATLGSRKLDDARSDAQGRFALAGVPVGARLIASRDGYEPGAAKVEAGAGDIELLLRAQVTVTGMVVTAEGVPVPDVQVLARGSGRGIATSDASGAFRLPLPGPGPVTLMAHHSSWGAGELSIEAPATGVRLQLETLGGVRARIVDSGGAPIAGGRAMAWRDDDSPRARDSYSSDLPSTAEGELVLAGLPEGPHRVRFSARGFQAAERRAVAIPASGIVELGDVVLEAGHEISGLVLKPDGSPAAGAWVHARGKGGGDGVAAGRDGAFTLVGLKEGSYTLAAFLDKSVAEASARTGDRNVTIRLPVATRLRGRVLDGAGRALTRFFVDDSPVDSPDGRFEVAVRAYRESVFFRVGADGKLTAFRQAKTAPDGTADAGDVVLEQARAIEGVVLDERGGPVPGASVSTGDGDEMRSRDDAQTTTVTRADGRFRIEGVTPGPTTVFARRGRQVAEKSVLVPADGDVSGVVLSLQAKGAIEGVIRGGDGKPLTAMVHTRNTSAVSDANGRYRLDGLMPGRHLVVVVIEAESYRALTRQVDVPAGETVKLDIDLASGGGLRITIAGAKTGTMHLMRSDSPVTMAQANPALLQTGQVVNGEATFTGLQAGRYSFWFYGDDDTSAQGEAQVVDAQVTRATATAQRLATPDGIAEPDPTAAVDPQ